MRNSKFNYYDHMHFIPLIAHFTPLLVPAGRRKASARAPKFLSPSLCSAVVDFPASRAMVASIWEKCNYQGSTSNLEGSWFLRDLNPSGIWFPPGNLSLRCIPIKLLHCPAGWFAALEASAWRPQIGKKCNYLRCNGPWHL